MKTAISIALLSAALVATPAGAQKGDASAKQKFVVGLQSAIRADDKNWLADHMSYPVNYFGKQKVVIRSKTSFINNYASFVTPKLRAMARACGDSRCSQDGSISSSQPPGRRCWQARSSTAG